MSATQSNPAAVYQQITDYLGWIAGDIENTKLDSYQLGEIVSQVENLLYIARLNHGLEQAKERGVQLTDAYYDLIEREATKGTYLENRYNLRR